MGDRYIISVICPRCTTEHEDVYYAPTCDFVEFICPDCDELIDLETYTGISAEDASNAAEIEVLIETIAGGEVRERG